MESDKIILFISCFVLSAIAGIAAVLRYNEKTKDPIKRISLLSAFLNSGFIGLGISLVWYTHFEDNIYLLIGICVLAGLGGMATVNYVLEVFRQKTMPQTPKSEGDK